MHNLILPLASTSSPSAPSFLLCLPSCAAETAASLGVFLILINELPLRHHHHSSPNHASLHYCSTRRASARDSVQEERKTQPAKAGNASRERLSKSQCIPSDFPEFEISYVVPLSRRLALLLSRESRQAIDTPSVTHALSPLVEASCDQEQ